MNACDALLLTSVHEGSPNVVKEALACELPVVSVNVGDVRTRIEGIDGCVVVDSASPDALAAALESVLRRNGRIVARDKIADLDEARIAAQVIDVYRSALRKSYVRAGTLADPETESRTVSRV